MSNPHVLLITFPAQGHINPALQFAKRLLSIGCRITYLTTVYVHRRMAENATLHGLSLAAFSDGHDDGLKPGSNMEHYMSELRSRGSEAMTRVVMDQEKQGQPFTCLVYSILLPWAPQVARERHLPTAFLWIQPATVLNIYYYYFNGYSDLIKENGNVSDTSSLINLPRLPPLTGRDLPSFFSASNIYASPLPTFEKHLKALSEDTNPIVLVNSFDALEPEALKPLGKAKMLGVGPLIPSAFSDGKDPLDTSFGGDLFQESKGYMEWLNSKPKSSVVYVSFGSISMFPRAQMEEIGRGLLESQRPFLWIIRGKDQNKENEANEDDEKLSCEDELRRQGMIVSWCSQVEVLSHEAVGCFVTHCGWNSAVESLVCGVPVVAFPQWADQGTNTKLIKDVWRTGVRVNLNEKGIVEGGEIRRCLDLVIGDGDKGEEMRRNAEKWKCLAREAAREGGSSDKNLKAFVDDIRRGQLRLD